MEDKNLRKDLTLKSLLLTLLKIGAIGFGGGMAMLGLLREHLVKRKNWLSDNDLSVAVAMGQILPGPFVPNYVEYIGYKLFRLKGMILSVIFFLFPSYLITLFLSFFYFHYQKVSLLEDAFTFISPAIPAILFYCAIRMGKDYIKNLSSLFFSFIAFWGLYFKLELFFVIALLGFLGIFLARIRQRKFVSSLFSFSPILLLQLFYIFLKIGALIFGGGFAAIPFIEKEVVTSRGLLTSKAFIDGVAISQITPGPVAILATFVGYGVGGILGSLVATIAIFLPSFIMLFFLIKVYEKIRENFYVKSFLSGVKPGIVGILLFSAFSLGKIAIFDLKTLIIALLSFSLLFFLEPIFIIFGLGILGIISGRLF
ncbi:MAG: chromate efflux transporter [candidate division WOR-3 bacterium]